MNGVFVVDNITNFTGQNIYEKLKSDILSLRIRPGEKISENELCEQFSVSRTPIRGVFQRLNAEGLISIEPYKSTCVTLLNFKEIEQLIYMRYAIEAAVLRDFVSNPDPMVIEKIRYRIRQQEVLLSTEFAAEQFYEMDAKLHSIWFEHTRREMLWTHINTGQAGYTRFRMLDIVIVKNFRQILDDHLRLFDAICSRDQNKVDEIIKLHVYGGINRLSEKIKNEFVDYFIFADEAH